MPVQVAESDDSTGSKSTAVEQPGDSLTDTTTTIPPPATLLVKKSSPNVKDRGSTSITPLPVIAATGVAADGAAGGALSSPAVGGAGEERPSHADKFASASATLKSAFARGYDHRRRGRAFSSTLPPPPPQVPLGVGGGSGWTGLRDLDGCVVWYTESVDSAAEADIESLASRAESVDSREDDLEATASTDSEVASTASSTGGTSSVCSGDSYRNRARERDLSLELCSTWSEEGEEDVLLGLSLARARMTAGKAACSCRETSCFCRFKNTAASTTSSRNRSQIFRTVPLPPPGPLARSELDPRDLALVAEINLMTKGSRDRRGRSACEERGGDAAHGAAPGGAAAVATGAVERLAVHPDCAFEFAERFVRRDIALAGRVQAVRLLHSSMNAIFSVIVRCGGFRALYGWLGDVWERVRAHKLARAGPPQWSSVGGRVYVEELLCVLARVPISVDMLRETEIARVAKKFRRLAERHGLESMTKASNQLRAHLHAVVSRGVQEGLFFRNRGSTAGVVPHCRGSPSQLQHPLGASVPYPHRKSEPWNSKEGVPWPTHGEGGGAVDFRDYGAPSRGRAHAPRSWRVGGSGSGGPLAGEASGGGGGSHTVNTRRDISLPFSGINMGNRPGLRSVQLRGWRWRQGGGDDGGDGVSIRGGGSDAGSVRGEDDARASDDGKRSEPNHSGSLDGSLSRDAARGEPLREGGQARNGEDGQGEVQGSNNSSSSNLAAGAIGGSPEPSSGFARRGSGNHPSARADDPTVVGSSGGRRGHTRHSSWRRRASKTEPWVLDLSNSGREVEQRRAGGFSADQSSPQQTGYGGSCQGRAGEEGGWSRWHGGENRMFRPLHREEGRDVWHPSNTSEDGSWEGTVDWWPRPRSPPPPGSADAYYTPGEYDSGKLMSPFLGPQGASSLLPAVPTFEESGTRVSWADYRGHRLAEVHEIEPGYSRGDFALPGHVGFITEACRRDMSKKEEQLLSLEDHERPAAAALESDVLRGRGYGSGAGGDSEGTISDSENSTTGEPDAGYQSNSSGGGGEGRERSAIDDGSGGDSGTSTSSNPALLHSSGGSQDGGSQDGGSQDGGSQCSGSQDGDDVRERAVGGNEDDRTESDTRGKERRSPQQSDPRTSPKNNVPHPNVLKDSSQNSPQDSPRRNLGRTREPGDDGGSESGCSSIHSPLRCFSPIDDVSPPEAESTMAPQRRFASPSGRSSPPRSPSVSSPGSSRSGSVAEGHVMFENREFCDRRDTVCRPPLARNPWNNRHEHEHEHEHEQPWELNASGSRGKSRWDPGRGRRNGGRPVSDPARKGRGGRMEGLRRHGERDGDAEEEEEEEEEEDKMYGSRATAALLLGVKSTSAEIKGPDAAGEGRKRCHRDLDVDGEHIGLGSVMSLNGRGGVASGEAAASCGFPGNSEVKIPPWYERQGGSPLSREGADVCESAAIFSPGRGTYGRPSTRRRVETDDNARGRNAEGVEDTGVVKILEGAGERE